MSTFRLLYSAASALAITLAGLAHDANLLAGRHSAAFDNTVDENLDALVGGFITTATGPSANGTIEIWVAGSYDGTAFAAGAGAADAAFTPTGEKLQMRLAHVITVDATSNHRYEFGPFSVAALFGGTLPPKFVVFIVHNTGVALHATAGNHEIKVMGVRGESV